MKSEWREGEERKRMGKRREETNGKGETGRKGKGMGVRVVDEECTLDWLLPNPQKKFLATLNQTTGQHLTTHQS